ncbi:MAG: hypothetical protein HYY37_05385 [Candidatus Aenigmarchaeota archaeon]|nr:hypothetical protein [Candidatus Aenigmarchaeota archaeon]
MEYELCMAEADFYDEMESRLMQMTLWAHKAVLFEKIKQKIEQQEGGKLDTIAELLVEASRNRLESERALEKSRDTFKEKLKETFEE